MGFRSCFTKKIRKKSKILSLKNNKVYVPLPDLSARQKMLQNFIPIDNQIDFDYIQNAKDLDGYSGSDIRLVCKECRMQGVRKAIQKIEILEKLQQENKTTHKKDKDKDKDKDNPANVSLDKITNSDFKLAFDRTKPASMYKQDKYVSWMEKFGSY